MEEKKDTPKLDTQPTHTTANPSSTLTNGTGAEESVEYVLKQRKLEMEAKQREPRKVESNLPKKPDSKTTTTSSFKPRKSNIMTLHDFKRNTKPKRRRRREDQKEEEDEDEDESDEDEDDDDEQAFRKVPRCKICLLALEGGEPTGLRTFDCRCLFHTECIDQWSRIKSKIDPKYITECPMHPSHGSSFF